MVLTVNGTIKGYYSPVYCSLVLVVFFFKVDFNWNLQYHMATQVKKRTRRLTDSPNKEICVLCNQKATKNAIQCDRCNKWEHKACAYVSDNIYAEINDVPMNIRFFCTPCCSVISSILEMHVALDSVTSSITAKLGNRL